MNKNIIFDFDGVIGDTWDATILSRMAISGLSRQGALDITDRKSTRLNSSHITPSRIPSSA